MSPPLDRLRGSSVPTLANVHKAFGCIGTITHGAVRDLDALDRLGFHVFATRVSVSHGWGAFVGFGEPVSVAGHRCAAPSALT